MEVQEDASSLLHNSYKTGKCSDVTIMNGDEEYRVHKLVLSASIPYFDKMFSTGLSESTSEVIKLDHPPIIFDLIIEWAYCSKILITEENAAELFHLADYMNIPKLTALCLDFLWNKSSDSPFIDVGHWINKIATEEVHDIIDRYICSNFWDIVNTETFLDYGVDTLDYIISLDDLHIDNEIQVFDAIIRWIQKDVERRSHLPKLLKKINWVDINGVQFMNRVDKLSWIMQDSTRPIIVAAVELSFFKSLKQIQINDVHSGPRNKSDIFHYAVYRKNDSSIEVHHFNEKYESINLSENLSLPEAKFGESHITQHSMDSDVVIRIDWRNKTYRLFNGSGSYSLLFGRLFQFSKENKRVYFWKGDRIIEFARLSENNTSSITAINGGLCVSIIAEPKVSNNCIFTSQLTIATCNPGNTLNRFRVLEIHKIVTKEPIKCLKVQPFMTCW
ncbi:kelch-like protein 25 [Tetranychus urticae]|uniref:BTB domain-containing protein n=1 Tax=Tetranychus urticae TaxID=32264 RepID=T1KW89_TETUR|nr:kelch-like protein 25 [Tetranychus urticae]